MARVTIEGSRLSPSTFLAAGERITVQRTERVERLIASGFVVEVADARTDTEREADEQAEQSRTDLTPYTLDNPPKRNASREDWAEFLGAHGALGIVTEGKDRDALIAAWDDYLRDQQG
ncbi:hypothetical protein AVV09_gp23 [Mycobacterium phage BrownCNA]|uniref:Tail assembly chaperone n=2 Tax=Coopervirus brownCNA TaxID=1983108 RepID=A0A5Q2WLG5_9CAUD|nr:hypothetical protein AVV09_gp23 [Mycobacterium phage BrownCNA]AKY02736.1 hypothetical protein SEA_BROWNCNA_23 [Mycobacterium phage BrownCNA]QGH80115.1 hypothetical protein SEA_MITHRIL_22 [Mycobacterium phage Mithril]